jgi:hypothetical protein
MKLVCDPKALHINGETNEMEGCDIEATKTEESISHNGSPR